MSTHIAAKEKCVDSGIDSGGEGGPSTIRNRLTTVIRDEHKNPVENIEYH